MSHALTLTIDEDAERIVAALGVPNEGFRLTHDQARELSGNLAMLATKLKMKIQVKRVKAQMGRLRAETAESAPAAEIVS